MSAPSLHIESTDSMITHKVLVDKMMKARTEGKKAFIRYTDGKLIVDGKPIDRCVLTPNPRNCNGSQQ